MMLLYFKVLDHSHITIEPLFIQPDIYSKSDSVSYVGKYSSFTTITVLLIIIILVSFGDLFTLHPSWPGLCCILSCIPKDVAVSSKFRPFQWSASMCSFYGKNFYEAVRFDFPAGFCLI